MSTLHFDKQGSFSNAVDLTMVLNESTNNSVPIAQKVGYEFDGWVSDYTSGGHVDEKVVTVYTTDGYLKFKSTDETLRMPDGDRVYLNGSSWAIRDDVVVTVYEDGTSWIAEYIPGSDTPIVTRTIKVYDSDGHAVRSDIFWSDDYPNGVYLSREDTTVYPIWSDAPFVKEFFDYSDQKCHLYTMVNGVLTRVEVILEDQDGS